MPRQPIRRSHAFQHRPLDAGRQVEVSTVGKANTPAAPTPDESKPAAPRSRQPQDPSARREQRHVQVVQHEGLIAKHRRAGRDTPAALMRDRRHRRLQARHVRFERHRHPVAEPPLHPVLTSAGTRSPRPRRPARRPRDARFRSIAASRPRPATSAKAPAAHRAAPRAATGRRPPATAAARPIPRACSEPPHRRHRRRQYRQARRHRAGVRRGRHRSPPPRLAGPNRDACRSNIVRYRPPRAISSSCVPSSTTRPCSSTQMRSA